MRSLIFSLILVLPSCARGAPDYPTSGAAAGAIARAGYFGPIEEWYDADILAAHPEVGSFVRSVRCRSREDDAVICLVDIVGVSQPPDLLFCRCGGGGAHEWSMVSELDNPDIPKIPRTPLSENEVRIQLRATREDAIEKRNIVNDAIKGYYRRLGMRERGFAETELADWILQSDDGLMREHALRMADELHIVAVLPAVDSLIATSTEDELTYGYTGIRHVTPLTDVRKHLADPTRHSF